MLSLSVPPTETWKVEARRGAMWFCDLDVCDEIGHTIYVEYAKGTDEDTNNYRCWDAD